MFLLKVFDAALEVEEVLVSKVPDTALVLPKVLDAALEVEEGLVLPKVLDAPLGVERAVIPLLRSCVVLSLISISVCVHKFYLLEGCVCSPPVL